MDKAIILFDRIFFILMTVSVGYLSIFALFSMWGVKKRYPPSPKKYRFLILIPAYKEDKVIMDSVNSLLNQDYPIDRYQIVVISDKMSGETNQILSKLPLNLLVVNPDESSKSYALNYAIKNIPDEKYDIVVILDADNIVESSFLSAINDAYYSGSTAIQAHRVAKNINSEMAVLDAISEEINNSIFRRGHINMGLSSALIGSGMAFDYKWFCRNCEKLKTSGEDKEIEILLLKDGIFIDFLEHVMVYDEKIQKESAFYNQRRRWMAAQFWSLMTGIKDLPKAIINNNIDYIDKVFQWALFPRIILIGFITLSSIATSLYDWTLSIKWWLLLILLVFTFAMAVPDYLVTKENSRTIKRLPILFILMFLNFFRMRGATKRFIHTEKG
jgi:cellulose synthase/poly-beta-1,6-N-acetylglucosamine synthase-like glycosyltransferase